MSDKLKNLCGLQQCFNGSKDSNRENSKKSKTLNLQMVESSDLMSSIRVEVDKNSFRPNDRTSERGVYLPIDKSISNITTFGTIEHNVDSEEEDNPHQMMVDCSLSSSGKWQCKAVDMSTENLKLPSQKSYTILESKEDDSETEYTSAKDLIAKSKHVSLKDQISMSKAAETRTIQINESGGLSLEQRNPPKYLNQSTWSVASLHSMSKTDNPSTL